MTETAPFCVPPGLVCPVCRSPLLVSGDDRAKCPPCDIDFERSGRVWNLLPPERRDYYAAFLASYTRIRKAEGRAFVDPSFLHNLPDCPPDHPLSWQWRVRSRSYRSLMPLLDRRLDRGSRILDLGAGIGWLSNRLARAGFEPWAIDISSDADDGLGASRHYEGAWPRILAEFDRLPLTECCVDAVIFNASFHYSTDYQSTLAESTRVVRPGGLIIILDTPIYKNRQSGDQMMSEQRLQFERDFGDRSDSLPHRGYLTWSQLDELGRSKGLRWHSRAPWYGLRWALRPVIAFLRGQREPARFRVLWSTRS